MERLSESDRELADRWLSNVRVRLARVGSPEPDPSSPLRRIDEDADDDVLAIVADDSDPERGWSFVNHLLQSARDEPEIRQIGIDALETLLRESGDQLADLFRVSIRSDKRLREAASHSYLSGKVGEIAKAEGIYPH